MGVTCIVVCGDEVLLADYKYGHGWNFPTFQFADPTESPTEVAHRDMKRDFSIPLPKITYLGFHFCRFQHRRDTIYCFIATVTDKRFRIKNPGIRAVHWFKVDSIPDTLSEYSQEIIHRWSPEIRAYYARYDRG